MSFASEFVQDVGRPYGGVVLFIDFKFENVIVSIVLQITNQKPVFSRRALEHHWKNAEFEKVIFALEFRYPAVVISSVRY